MMGVNKIGVGHSDGHGYGDGDGDNIAFIHCQQVMLS